MRVFGLRWLLTDAFSDEKWDLPEAHGTVTLMRHIALLIGDWDHAHFRDARREIDRVLPVMRAPTVTAALAILEQHADFLFVAIAQSRPGEFLESEIQQLQAAAPLSRLVVLLGSWCEGETRSGRPWPGVARVYAHQFWARLRSEDWRQVAATGQVPWATLPTISPEELGLQRGEAPLPQLSGQAVICGDDRANRAALAEFCQALGLQTVDGRLSDGPTCPIPNLVLYDAHRDRGRRSADLQWLSGYWPTAPILTLIGFPRADEIQEATAAGCRHVLGKPYLIDDLVACIRDALVHRNHVC